MVPTTLKWKQIEAILGRKNTVEVAFGNIASKIIQDVKNDSTTACYDRSADSFGKDGVYCSRHSRIISTVGGGAG